MSDAVMFSICEIVLVFRLCFLLVDCFVWGDFVGSVGSLCCYDGDVGPFQVRFSFFFYFFLLVLLL